MGKKTIDKNGLWHVPKTGVRLEKGQVSCIFIFPCSFPLSPSPYHTIVTYLHDISPERWVAPRLCVPPIAPGPPPLPAAVEARGRSAAACSTRISSLQVTTIKKTGLRSD